MCRQPSYLCRSGRSQAPPLVGRLPRCCRVTTGTISPLSWDPASPLPSSEHLHGPDDSEVPKIGKLWSWDLTALTLARVFETLLVQTRPAE